MAHYPVNHHLRPLYRVIAGLTGLAYLAFGLVGIIGSASEPVFQRGGIWVFGLPVNLASAVLALLIGAVVLAGVVIGRNHYHRVVTYAGWAVIVIGLFSMAVLQTEVNILNFSMANVLAYLITGLLLIAAGLYGRVQAADGEHTGPGVGHQPDSTTAPEELPRPMRDTVDR